mmetsp:Transcript_50381/g.58810  ORF Transcript_50381/g.58810 Transcript_50381/m.58810 type:complete len:317 (-) Transcript_50381:105-1055(-)|eukprot:CAMPEP_0194358258 /NCGR_PEP_ID=MMETSP0174-20130528/5528_1 /TAXON_ID=216777 /ORGANISM="Proboscia alata, Strain PI-D3" /LENGTH=316 /DNA_ID=CAMNT_0039128521 /DNA_START=118 /DNA_END=1068 /DNA_ORIENTATION=+
MSSTSSEPKVKGVETIEKFSKPIIGFVTTALPFVIEWVQKGYDIWVKIPSDVARLIVGIIFCFFGGVYPTLFAAIQAVKAGGFNVLQEAIIDLTEEAQKIMEASKKDDDVDADKDGTPDVEQIGDEELIIRKMSLVVTKMNPAKVDNAMTAIYRIWFTVIATLTVKFAMVVTLAMTLSDFLKDAINRVLKPIVDQLIPDKYAKWVPVIVGWATKAFAMSIAWTIQSVICAFTSACEGGLIISRTLIKMLVKEGITLGGILPKDHTKSVIDEYASYGFALLGFLFQWKMGFDVPFPFNIVLFPLEISEIYIRWTITK